MQDTTQAIALEDTMSNPIAHPEMQNLSMRSFIWLPVDNISIIAPQTSGNRMVKEILTIPMGIGSLFILATKTRTTIVALSWIVYRRYDSWLHDLQAI